jgi:Lysylphosphatidylglycerol synthase TM region
MRSLDRQDIGSLLAVFALMLVNWGLEAHKWQLMIQRLQPMSWYKAFKATLTGTTLAFFTPNRMGEYFGRVLYIQEGKRVKAISLTIVGSMAQLLVTLVIGAAGIRVIRDTLLAAEQGGASGILWIDTVFYITLLGAFVLTLFYFRLAWLVRWIRKIPRIEKVTGAIEVLGEFPNGLLLRILALSVLRYGVFIVQYYLLFAVFKVELTEWQVFWSVSVVFLVMAIVPTIALLTELGVRWKTSLQIIQLFSNNFVGILATSLAIWLINLVVPALMGSLLILNIRLFRYRQEKKRKNTVNPEDAKPD